MATDYSVIMASGTIIDEITISTSRTFEDMQPFNDFVVTLSLKERQLVGLISEYQLEGWEDNQPEPLTELECIVIDKYNAFFEIETNTFEDEEEEEEEEDREICPCCGKLRELYYSWGNPVGKCGGCINKG